jgi:hypothetical protein
MNKSTNTREDHNGSNVIFVLLGPKLEHDIWSENLFRNKSKFTLTFRDL